MSYWWWTARFEGFIVHFKLDIYKKKTVLTFKLNVKIHKAKRFMDSSPKSCHKHLFLLNTKKVRNPVVTDFSSVVSPSMNVNEWVYQSLFLCSIEGRNSKQVGDMSRVSKWWLNLHNWVNNPFKQEHSLTSCCSK